MPQVRADFLVHDDACHFEQFVMKHRSSGFDAIKFYLVDTFQTRNHKCEKSIRPHSHKFLVEEACQFYNANFKEWPSIMTRRTTRTLKSMKNMKSMK